MAESCWFTRGWMFQELITPIHVTFYGQSWAERGTEEEFASLLSKITGIDIRILSDPSQIHTIPVCTRMSWAADRETTRIEDRA